MDEVNNHTLSFSLIRSIPSEDQVAVVRSLSSVMGIPVDPNFDLQNAINFFDTQIELLESPLWHNTIRQYEPIRQSLFKSA